MELHGPLLDRHPLYTPTTLCIEGVAAIIRGDCGARNVLSPDHYLCSGLDLYLEEEPDLMSSMALVHSRIRRVFFRDPAPSEGALYSHYKLHTLRALNHRFRVFRVHVNNDSSKWEHARDFKDGESTVSRLTVDDEEMVAQSSFENQASSMKQVGDGQPVDSELKLSPG